MELFFKRKIGIENVMIDLIKNLKAYYDIQVRNLRCNNERKDVDFKRTCNRKDGDGV